MAATPPSYAGTTTASWVIAVPARPGRRGVWIQNLGTTTLDRINAIQMAATPSDADDVGIVLSSDLDSASVRITEGKHFFEGGGPVWVKEQNGTTVAWSALDT